MHRMWINKNKIIFIDRFSHVTCLEGKVNSCTFLVIIFYFILFVSFLSLDLDKNKTLINICGVPVQFTTRSNSYNYLNRISIRFFCFIVQEFINLNNKIKCNLLLSKDEWMFYIFRIYKKKHVYAQKLKHILLKK